MNEGAFEVEDENEGFVGSCGAGIGVAVALAVDIGVGAVKLKVGKDDFEGSTLVLVALDVSLGFESVNEGNLEGLVEAAAL